MWERGRWGGGLAAPAAAGPLWFEGCKRGPAAGPERWERLPARHRRKGVILDGNFPPRKGKKNPEWTKVLTNGTVLK